ncbi:type II secretion system protein [Lysinibacillus telephonicus]|uniref:prepilin-type N-terminal cleavage/methylation domain-containing protein n=1 Tax=Lysinibacillus telephonicus TaxID=1714840 RepID=UPI0039798D07
MKGILKNNHGYTLIEMLIVLFIVVTISSIVFQFTIKLTEKRVVEQFFNEVMLDIQRVQALAIEEGRTITFVFIDNNTYKAYYELGGKSILEKSFPKGIELNIYSNLKKIEFYPSGEIGKFGTVLFNTPFGEKRLIVNMQKGRLRLNE